MIIKVFSWNDAQADAAPIRQAVFCVEQKVPPELEWDEMDEVSLHAVAYDAAGTPVGTGRLLPDGHIGRMAVLPLWRGRGIGGALLKALVGQAASCGLSEVVLHAQTHAAPFYMQHGFAGEGEIFIEAGIPHVLMRLRLKGRP